MCLFKNQISVHTSGILLKLNISTQIPYANKTLNPKNSAINLPKPINYNYSSTCFQHTYH